MGRPDQPTLLETQQGNAEKLSIPFFFFFFAQYRLYRPPPADPARLASLLQTLWESQWAACRAEVLLQLGEPLGRTGATAEQLEGEAGGVTGGEGTREGVGQLGSGRGGHGLELGCWSQMCNGKFDWVG